MPKDLSRRKVLIGGASVAASVGFMKMPQKPNVEEVGALQQVKDSLAKPLEGEALAGLPDAVKTVAETSRARWTHKLVENSEPNMVFEALPKEARTW